MATEQRSTAPNNKNKTSLKVVKPLGNLSSILSSYDEQQQIKKDMSKNNNEKNSLEEQILHTTSLPLEFSSSRDRGFTFGSEFDLGFENLDGNLVMDSVIHGESSFSHDRHMNKAVATAGFKSDTDKGNSSSNSSEDEEANTISTSGSSGTSSLYNNTSIHSNSRNEVNHRSSQFQKQQQQKKPSSGGIGKFSHESSSPTTTISDAIKGTENITKSNSNNKITTSTKSNIPSPGSSQSSTNGMLSSYFGTSATGSSFLPNVDSFISSATPLMNIPNAAQSLNQTKKTPNATVAHTPPSMFGTSYETRHFGKRMRAGSISGRVRAMSDLQDKGIIDRSQKNILKDLIITGDDALQKALDLYEQGDASQLEVMIKSGVFQNKETGDIDLLAELDLDFLTMNDSGTTNNICLDSLNLDDEDGIDQTSTSDMNIKMNMNMESSFVNSSSSIISQPMKFKMEDTTINNNSNNNNNFSLQGDPLLHRHNFHHSNNQNNDRSTHIQGGIASNVQTIIHRQNIKIGNHVDNVSSEAPTYADDGIGDLEFNGEFSDTEELLSLPAGQVEFLPSQASSGTTSTSSNHNTNNSSMLTFQRSRSTSAVDMMRFRANSLAFDGLLEEPTSDTSFGKWMDRSPIIENNNYNKLNNYNNSKITKPKQNAQIYLKKKNQAVTSTNRMVGATVNFNHVKNKPLIGQNNIKPQSAAKTQQAILKRLEREEKRAQKEKEKKEKKEKREQELREKKAKEAREKQQKREMKAALARSKAEEKKKKKTESLSLSTIPSYSQKIPEVKQDSMTDQILSEEPKFVESGTGRPRSLSDPNLSISVDLNGLMQVDRPDGWIGAYSPDSRKIRIERFLKKRNHRVWTKKVKYDVRKNFADSRLRVKGRFVKKEDELLMRDLMSLT